MRDVSIVLVLACLLIATAVPHASAAPEFRAAPYSAAAGGSSTLYVGMFFSPSIGGAVLSATAPHAMVIVDVSDNAFQDTAYQVCDGDLGPSAVTSGAPAAAGCADPVCGPSIFATGGSVTDITVFVFASYTDPYLNPCFGFTGEMVAFFD